MMFVAKGLIKVSKNSQVMKLSHTCNMGNLRHINMYEKLLGPAQENWE